jgi:hypothetical protein
MRRSEISAVAIEKMVNEQVRAWEMKKKQKKEASRPIITIYRQFGTGSGEIVNALAKEMGLNIYSSAIIDEVAKSSRMSADVIASLDEKGRSMLDDWLSYWKSNRNMVL